MIREINNRVLTVERPQQTPQTPEQKKLMKTCIDFETLMVQKMLEVMQSSTKLFGQGFGGDFFQGMYQEQIAKQITENGQGTGLAKMLYQQLNRPNIIHPNK